MNNTTRLLYIFIVVVCCFLCLLSFFSPTNHLLIKITDCSFYTRNLVFGINFQIHFVSLTSLVSIHFLVLLLTHSSHHPHSQYPLLLHFFTPDRKSTFSTYPSNLNRFGTVWTAFTDQSLDCTGFIMLVGLLWTPAQSSLSEVHVMFCECYFIYLFIFMAALCSRPC